MHLTKVHGSENDFFILDQTQLNTPLSNAHLDKLRLAICSRKTGLLSGADGILVVDNAENSTALAKMRVINSDGSEASMCGNGLRTVARYLSEKNDLDSFNVETMFADLKVRKAAEIGEGITTFQVEISPVSFDPDAVPVRLTEGPIIDQIIPELSDSIAFSIVAVPNPHLIAFVDNQTLNSSVFEEIAQKVNQKNDLFPDGVNVSFVEVLGKNEIFVKTFERGVGLTNACGTAMTASSLIYVLLHNGEFVVPITVKNAGGMVKTVVHENPEGGYWMELVGNATFTYFVDGRLEDILNQNFSSLKITKTQEQENYDKFLQTIEK